MHTCHGCEIFCRVQYMNTIQTNGSQSEDSYWIVWGGCVFARGTWSVLDNKYK